MTPGGDTVLYARFRDWKGESIGVIICLVAQHLNIHEVTADKDIWNVGKQAAQEDLLEEDVSPLLAECI